MAKGSEDKVGWVEPQNEGERILMERREVEVNGDGCIVVGLDSFFFL